MKQIQKQPYIINHLRTRKIKDGIFITTDFGSWAYLTEEEYKKLRNNELEEPMLTSLKEKGIIFQGNNLDKLIETYRKKHAYLFQGPSLHIIIPTQRCNLKCLYCHAMAQPLNKEGYDMSFETAKKTVDFIFQTTSNAVTIEFQGGEPLLRFDLVKYIIKYAKELNKKHKKKLLFSIVTNFTLMTDEIFEFLKKERIGICTSLDGPAIVHNKNRQEYEKTSFWIEKIKKSYHIHAMPIITKNSLPYYKEIIDEYIKFDLRNIWLKPTNRIGYAKENWESLKITPEEFLDFYKKALDYLIEKNKEILLIENFTRVLFRKIFTDECVNFTDLQSPCGAAIGQLAYNYDGSIRTCDEGRLYDLFKLGTVDDSYEDIMKSPQTCGIVKASMNDNPVCEICAYKPYCGLCPVCNYALTGNIISRLPNDRCKMFMGMFDYVIEKTLFDKNYKKIFVDWTKHRKRNIETSNQNL